MPIYRKQRENKGNYPLPPQSTFLARTSCACSHPLEHTGMYLVPTSEVYKQEKSLHSENSLQIQEFYVLLDLILILVLNLNFFFCIEHCVILLSHNNLMHNWCKINLVYARWKGEYEPPGISILGKKLLSVRTIILSRLKWKIMIILQWNVLQ